MEIILSQTSTSKVNLLVLRSKINPMSKTVFPFIFILLILSSCSTTSKIEALKPEADNAAPLEYERSPSYINLPIALKIKDLENKTNAILQGLIYEDSNIEDDGIEMKIWKLAPIAIENKNGKIKVVLPLKANVKYRIGTTKLGVEMYNTQEFNLNGTVTLISEIHLTNWKINTKTHLESLDWNESPTTTILGKTVSITYLINPTVRLFKSKIERKIDESIVKSLDFKPNVLEALEKVCSPFQMNEAYDAWLRITPLELYTTDAQFIKESINLNMGMKCEIETLIGQKPITKIDRNKIALKTIEQIPNKINATIAAISSYENASRIISKNFSGQEFSSGSKKVTVKNVAVWHKKGKIIIALDLTGSVNGSIYLSGYPQYNENTKEIYFDQLDYVLDTKSKLIKTANWFVQSYILKKIQQNCRYSIQPNLEEVKASMKHYLTKYSPLTGVIINGIIDDIQFQKIQLTNKEIIAFVKINGKAAIVIDGLK
jgi:hypothetical protein